MLGVWCGFQIIASAVFFSTIIWKQKQKVLSTLPNGTLDICEKNEWNRFSYSVISGYCKKKKKNSRVKM